MNLKDVGDVGDGTGPALLLVIPLAPRKYGIGPSVAVFFGQSNFCRVGTTNMFCFIRTPV